MHTGITAYPVDLTTDNLHLLGGATSVFLVEMVARRPPSETPELLVAALAPDAHRGAGFAWPVHSKIAPGPDGNNVEPAGSGTTNADQVRNAGAATWTERREHAQADRFQATQLPHAVPVPPATRKARHRDRRSSGLPQRGSGC